MNTGRVRRWRVDCYIRCSPFRKTLLSESHAEPEAALAALLDHLQRSWDGVRLTPVWIEVEHSKHVVMTGAWQ